jgi:hypothetical protein
MAYFPNLTEDSIRTSKLPYLTDVQASLDDKSPTLLINAATGEKVAHWTELDYSGERIPVGQMERKTLLIWPAEPLEYGTHYIVAIRDVRDSSGALVQASESFTSLRDDLQSPNPDVEGKREMFEELLKIVETSAEVERDGLQLMWDFTTTSKFTMTNRLVHARDDALARLDAGEFSYNITRVEDEPNEDIARSISGTFQVPFYLNRDCKGMADICSDVRLVMDGEGNPVFQGYAEFGFEMLIPRSLVAEGASPGVLHQYGHGLLGSRTEINYGSQRALRIDADRFGWILLSTDWIGMSDIDTPSIIAVLSDDLGDFAMVPDRSVQGVVNALYLMRLAKGPLSEDPIFLVGPEGRSVIDKNFGPANPIYSGNSQGGILGGVYMAASQDVERGVLGVPGVAYSMMMPRSSGTGDMLISLIKARYSDPVSLMIAMHMVQMLWDRAEPSGFMATVNGEDRLPNTPSHQVFMHYSLGDSLVSWLSTFMQARSVNAVTFESNVKYDEVGEELFGFEFAKDTEVIEGRSIMVGFEYEGVPIAEFRNLPPNSETDTHEYTRKTEACRIMMDMFFRTGGISNVCEGPCIFPPQ